MATKKYQATQFKAPEEAEVSGMILMAYLDNLQKDLTEPILKQYGFDADNIDVDQWYPNQMFLDIEKSIYETEAGENALVAIGKSAVENYIPPEGIETLEDALMALPDVYTTNQRNLPKGYGWIVEKLGEKHYRFVNNTGTANHGAYGYVWALCNKMQARNQIVYVTPIAGFEDDHTEPGIFDITW
jgi:hypothetical protein